MYYNGLGAILPFKPGAYESASPELQELMRIALSTSPQQRPQKSEGWKTTRRCRYVYVCD